LHTGEVTASDENGDAFSALPKEQVRTRELKLLPSLCRSTSAMELCLGCRIGKPGKGRAGGACSEGC